MYVPFKIKLNRQGGKTQGINHSALPSWRLNNRIKKIHSRLTSHDSRPNPIFHYLHFKSGRMDVKIEASWKEVLEEEFKKPYFKQIREHLKTEKAQGKIIYPPGSLIFNAFEKTPIEKLKVVILGQDPYHGPRQAMGLSFSVPYGIPVPPSLINIFKELHDDTGSPIPSHGNLTSWAEQGVMLLNASLTVRAGEPMSHAKIGWHSFTNSVISSISTMKKNVVFLLWGKFAQEKMELVDAKKHICFKAAHPSPLSASHGFFGCKHFSKTNTYLMKQGLDPINWALPE
jgi:uracil-DNA glycosylase